jgi:hypothetical protein
MSILSFISVCKDITKKSEPTSLLKQRILEAFYRANEKSRAYYLEEGVKSLFSRCLRLFFFYQKRDVFESLLLNDYGFYTFYPVKNYLDYH